MNGEEVKRDIGLGVAYIELSAKQGFPNAQFSMGMIYASYKHLEKAHPWFEKAAAQGYQPAQMVLKIFLDNR